MKLYTIRMTFVFPQLPGVMFYVRLIDQPISNHRCLKNLNLNLENDTLCRYFVTSGKNN